MDKSRKGVAALAALATAATLHSAQVAAAVGFEEVTSEAGFDHSGETYGVSWGDFNGDGYPDVFVNNHREWASLYRNNADGTFTDVILTADGSGRWKDKPKHDNHGAAWADFDGDGDQDLYVTTGGADDALMLVNEGGVLHDRGAELGLAEDVEGRLPVWVDFSRDGRLDLAVMIRSESKVFRQSGSTPTVFHTVTPDTGLDCRAVDYGQLSDFNGDGIMELICGNGTFPHNVYDIANYVINTTPFNDITDIVPSVPRATDTAIADFDGDLDPDVFVIAGKKIPSEAALTGSSSLEALVGVAPGAEKGFSFQSAGTVTVDVHVKRQIRSNNNIYIGANGTHPADVPFTLDPTDPAVHGFYPRDPETDSGVFIGYDPDTAQWRMFVSGLEDHAAGAYFDVESTAAITGLEMLNLETGDMPERPYLLANVGGTFLELGDSRGLQEPVWCVSLAAGDFDNDMDVDVYAVCRGGVRNLPNRLYENIGNGVFKQVSGHGAEGVEGFHLADKAGLGDSAAIADYDVDGCLDLFVTNGLPLQPGRHDSGPDQMFRNDCDNGNHWLQLDLRGQGVGGSNPDGLGATVYVTAGGVTQMREQNGGTHRWSQNHTRLHFGLGGNTTVDEVRILWPSGDLDIIPGDDIDVDGVYRVTEGENEFVPVSFGGGDFPAPEAGDECGVPGYDRRIHRAVLLWKNCDTGVWSLRVISGKVKPAMDYEGTIVSNQPFVSVTPRLMEGADEAVTDGAGTLEYLLRMSGAGEDGFDFQLASGASGCLNITAPQNMPLLVGGGSLTADFPLDLNTMGSCSAQTSDPQPGDDTSTPPDNGAGNDLSDACGMPYINAGSERGLYLWRDCLTGDWSLRVTAGGPDPVVYEGAIAAMQSFPSAPVGFSLEPSDTLDSSASDVIDFSLRVRNSGQDGIDFRQPADGNTCLSLDLPDDVQIFIGADKKAVGQTVDLGSLTACSI